MKATRASGAALLVSLGAVLMLVFLAVQLDWFGTAERLVTDPGPGGSVAGPELRQGALGRDDPVVPRVVVEDAGAAAAQDGGLDPAATASILGGLAVRVVLAPGGEGVAGLELRIERSRPESGDAPLLVRTGPDGRWLGNGFVATDYQLVAPSRPDVHGDVAVVAGTTAELELRMSAGVDLRGRVTDDAGRPLAGASILLRPMVASRDACVVVASTDRDGVYRARDVHPLARVAATAAGFRPSEAREVHAERGAEVQLDFVLSSAGGGSVHGRVWLEGGVAADRGVVGLLDPDDGIGRRTVAIQDDGSFRIESIAAGERVLEARVDGRAAVRNVVVIPDGAGVDHDFICGPGAQVEGVVIGPDGGPRAGVAVAWATGFGDTGTLVSGADGRFGLATLPAATVRLHASATDGLEAAREIEADGRSTYRVELVLAAAADGIRGRVVDPSGAPVGDAMVSWMGDGEDLPTGFGVTDEAGRFELREVGSASSGVLTVAASGWESVQVGEVLPGTSDLLVALRERVVGVRIRGRLVDALGDPIVGAEVTLGSELKLSDQRGRFDLPAVRGRVTELLIEAVGFAAIRRSFRPEGDQDLGDLILVKD